MSTPSSRTPAVCRTAVSGCSAGIAASRSASASRSAASQAANVTSAPSSVSSRSRADAPGADAPRLLVSSKCRTPCSVTRCLATSAPSVPVPPVTRTVPLASQVMSGPAVARAIRGARSSPRRIATCGSPDLAAASTAAREAGSSSTSTSTNRPGFSAWAERNRPSAAAAVRFGTSSCSVTATAPWETSTSRDCSLASQSWASVRASCTLSGAALTTYSESSSAEVTGTQLISYSESSRRRRPPVGSGRDTSLSTDTTGAPVSSAACTWRSGVRRTRRALAPTACRDTPVQANGSSIWSPWSIRNGCNAASSSAGCTPNSAALSCWSSGSLISAYKSAPCRQAACRPWKTGP